VLINPARNQSIFRRRSPIRLWCLSQHLLRLNPLPRSQFGSRRRFPRAASQRQDNEGEGPTSSFNHAALIDDHSIRLGREFLLLRWTTSSKVAPAACRAVLRPSITECYELCSRLVQRTCSPCRTASVRGQRSPLATPHGNNPRERSYTCKCPADLSAPPRRQRHRC
jgi:hypothetical protein